MYAIKKITTKETAREIAFNIIVVDRFFALFIALQETMQGLQDGN